MKFDVMIVLVRCFVYIIMVMFWNYVARFFIYFSNVIWHKICWPNNIWTVNRFSVQIRIILLLQLEDELMEQEHSIWKIWFDDFQRVVSELSAINSRSVALNRICVHKTFGTRIFKPIKINLVKNDQIFRFGWQLPRAYI